MKTTTKKITASICILLGFAPLLFIVVTYIKQQEIHHSMVQQLENKMLQTITLAKDEVSWLRKGKEILINGRMFDVKSFQASGDDKILFKGLYDDDETALVNKMKQTQKNENNNGGKLLAQLFQLLQSSCNNSFAEVFIPSIKHHQFPGLEERLASQYITIFSPPPRAS